MKQSFFGRFLAFFVVLMSIVSTPGCGTLDKKNQADRLERALTYYTSSLRWARYREAVGLHVTKDGKVAEVNLEQLEQFGVTSVDIFSKTVTLGTEKDGVDEATILAEVNYFHKEQGTIRKLKLKQTWWFNKKVNAWLIESDFPEFK